MFGKLFSSEIFSCVLVQLKARSTRASFPSTITSAKSVPKRLLAQACLKWNITICQSYAFSSKNRASCVFVFSCKLYRISLRQPSSNFCSSSIDTRTSSENWSGKNNSRKDFCFTETILKHISSFFKQSRALSRDEIAVMRKRNLNL